MAFLSKIDVPRGAFIVVVVGRAWPHVELLSGFIGPEVSPLDTHSLGTVWKSVP